MRNTGKSGRNSAFKSSTDKYSKEKKFNREKPDRQRMGKSREQINELRRHLNDEIEDNKDRPRREATSKRVLSLREEKDNFRRDNDGKAVHNTNRENRQRDYSYKDEKDYSHNDNDADEKPRREFRKTRESSTGRDGNKRDYSYKKDEKHRSYNDTNADEKPRREFRKTRESSTGRDGSKRDYSYKKDEKHRSYNDTGADEKPRREFRKTRESSTGRDGNKRDYSYKKDEKHRSYNDTGADEKPRREFRKTRESSTGRDGNNTERKYSKEDRFSESRYHKSDRSKSYRNDKKDHPEKYIRRTKTDDDKIRLNKFIANAGVCSRREADELILNGAIKVNGVIVTELGYKISPDEDKVVYGEERLSGEKKRYILLNKPKGYITTVDDPEGRKTVMLLIKNACRERVYPVGRLDRNTTGLLLFTNDGDLAKRLTHPKHGVTKLYHVELDKSLAKGDMVKIMEGVELDGNIIQVDALEYTGEGNNRKQLGIELHSGQNRVVRRIFERFGYEVAKLDRVSFAGLTKKDLPRGHWRFLTNEEINILRRVH